jgi:hypothetical protein
MQFLSSSDESDVLPVIPKPPKLAHKKDPEYQVDGKMRNHAKISSY